MSPVFCRMHPTSSSPPRSSSSPSAASAASVTATAAASVASTTDDEPRTFSNTLSDDDLLSLVLSFLPLPSLTHSRATSKRFRTFVLRSLYARHGKSAVEKAIADLPADEEECKFHVRDLFADEDTRELILAALGEGRAQAWAWESEDPKTRKWLPYTPEATAALDAAYAAGEARCELLIGKASFTVDFAAGQQYNKQKASRPVRRQRFGAFEEMLMESMLHFTGDEQQEGLLGVLGGGELGGELWAPEPGSPRGGPSLDEGRRLLDALERACGPSLQELHCAVCSLVRNRVTSMAQHLVKSRPETLRARFSIEHPPLHHAVRNNATAAMKWLIAEGQDVREVASHDCGSDSVLAYAHDCCSGSATWLLEHHPECADVANPNEAHRTAVQLTRQAMEEEARADAEEDGEEGEEGEEGEPDPTPK